MSAPLPLVTTFIIGVIRSMDFSGEWSLYSFFRAGLGSIIGLNPQCSHPAETTKLNAHNNQRQGLNSAQTRLTGVTGYF